MSRHPASATDKIPVTAGMKRRTSGGATKRRTASRSTGRARGVTSAKPWSPSMGIYMDLKIPIVAK